MLVLWGCILVDDVNFSDADKFEHGVNTHFKDDYSFYITDVIRYEVMSRAEELETIKLVRSGCQKSREKMIVTNLRLVVSVARRFRGRVTHRLSLLDLIAEGNIGLIKAVDKFDYKLEYRFSTYAVWWISDSITTAIMNQNDEVRIPIHVQKEANRIKVIARTNGVNSIDHMTISLYSELCNENTDHVSNVFKYNQIQISTHQMFANDPKTPMSNLVDLDFSNPLGATITNELYEKLQEALNKTPTRYKDVVTRRFGIHGKSELTLKETGLELNLSAERVRQLQKAAISDIRNRLEAYNMSDFIDGKNALIEQMASTCDYE